MSSLFELQQIKGMKVKNRLVRSATYEGKAAKDGRCTPELVELYGELARGGVGLIISGYAWVHRTGQCARNMFGIDREEVVPGLKILTRTVHDNGGVIVLQVAHGGVYAIPALAGKPVLGPSAGRFPPWNYDTREMNSEDISTIVNAFGQAARRAREAGFDGVQVHGAHGYLVSEFLSPFYNRRGDDYGGTPEGRARLAVEICKAMRAEVGDDYPIMIKMNAEDYVDGGLEIEQTEIIIPLLAEAGYDCIEISGGGHASRRPFGPSRSKITSADREAYFLPQARRLREVTDVPLMLVGGIRSLDVIERILSEGVADYISLCRPFLREPDLPNRWANGDRRPAACTSCNRCLFAMASRPVACYAEESPESLKMDMRFWPDAENSSRD